MNDLLAGWIIGLQLVSPHYGSGASELEWATPGIYARHPSGATASVYRNSQGRASVLAGWTWEFWDRRIGLTAGVVTGYSMAPVLPVVIPSARFEIGSGWALRLSVIPPIKEPAITGAVAVALEVEL